MANLYEVDVIASEHPVLGIKKPDHGSTRKIYVKGVYCSGPSGPSKGDCFLNRKTTRLVQFQKS